MTGRVTSVSLILGISLFFTSTTVLKGQSLTGSEEEDIASAMGDLASVCIESAGDRTTAEDTLAKLSEYELMAPHMARGGSGKTTFLLASSADDFSCVFVYDPNFGAEDTSISANVARTVAALDIIKSNLATQLNISESDFVEERGTLIYASEALEVLILPRSSIRIAVSQPN